MAASINDKITDTFNSANPNSARVTSTRTAAGASLSCDNLAGWPTVSKVHFTTYKIDTNSAKVAGSQIDWSGIVSGNTIGTMTRLAGATDAGNAIGDVVEMMPTASWAHDLFTGFTAQHSQLDGTHGAVTATSVASTGTVSGTTGVFSSDVSDNATTLKTIRTEYQFDFVASGLVWSGLGYGSLLTGAMTSGVVYINGQRLAIGAVATHTFTASKDTYIDILNTAGVGSVVYTEVANNAASPALAANSLRIGIIISGVNIAAATSVNQGQETMVLPIASSIPYAVTDSLGNLICPRDPNRRVLGYRQVTTNLTSTTATGSGTDMTGLNFTCIIPTGRKVKVTGFIGNGSASIVNNAVGMELYDVTAAAVIGSALNATNASGDQVSVAPAAVSSAGGTRNYKARLFRGGNAATANSNGSLTNPNIIMAELV